MVGREPMTNFGWKVGDRMPIRGTIWGGNWDFNVPGYTTAPGRRTIPPSSGYGPTTSTNDGCWARAWWDGTWCR